MRTYSSIEVIKLFKQKDISLFTLSDFARLLNLSNKNTIYKKIQRLEGKGIIKKLTKGRYIFVFKKPADFTLANFLYQPSYISLESALSFYGIITGFPYQITSVTIKKTKNFSIEGKEYSYAQINNELFWGYEKKEDFLIAEKEKSLLDYLYLAFKGLRNSDISEFDFSSLDKRKLEDYLKKIKNSSFVKFARRIKI